MVVFFTAAPFQMVNASIRPWKVFSWVLLGLGLELKVDSAAQKNGEPSLDYSEVLSRARFFLLMEQVLGPFADLLGFLL